jgi:hypothetical protein
MVSGVAEGNVLPGRGARAWGMGGRGGHVAAEAGQGFAS